MSSRKVGLRWALYNGLNMEGKAMRILFKSTNYKRMPVSQHEYRPD